MLIFSHPIIKYVSDFDLTHWRVNLSFFLKNVTRQSSSKLSIILWIILVSVFIHGCFSNVGKQVVGFKMYQKKGLSVLEYGMSRNRFLRSLREIIFWNYVSSL